MGVPRAIPCTAQDGGGDQACFRTGRVGVALVAMAHEQGEAGEATTQLQVDGKPGACERRREEFGLQGEKPPPGRRRSAGRRLVHA